MYVLRMFILFSNLLKFRQVSQSTMRINFDGNPSLLENASGNKEPRVHVGLENRPGLSRSKYVFAVNLAE